MSSELKVAVCLFGQMRTYKECQKSFDEYILKPLEPDIFIHTWKNPGVSKRDIVPESSVEITTKVLENTYSCKSAIVEKFDDDYYHHIGDVQLPDCHEYIPEWQYGMIPMFYKIWSVNQLKLKAELSEGFKYDLVVMMRPDYLLREPLPEEVLANPESLWIRKRGHPMDVFADDQLLISSSANMDIVADIWCDLTDYWQSELGPNNGPIGLPKSNMSNSYYYHMGKPERIMSHHIQISSIQVQELKMNAAVARSYDLLLEFMFKKPWKYVRRGGIRLFLKQLLLFLGRKI